MSDKKEKKPVLVDATNRPYQKKLKTLVLYWEIPYENPRKQLNSDLPLGDVVQEDLRNIDQIKDKYDIIAAISCIQCLEPNTIPETLQKLAAMLELKGELYVAVPAFEWAAAQVGSDRPDPLIHLIVCGQGKAPHRSVLTLQWLRSLMMMSNLVIRTAVPEIYTIPIDGKPYQVVRNMVIGWKYDDFTAATALN
jgi:hypothetical protein